MMNADLDNFSASPVSRACEAIQNSRENSDEHEEHLVIGLPLLRQLLSLKVESTRAQGSAPPNLPLRREC